MARTPIFIEPNFSVSYFSLRVGVCYIFNMNTTYRSLIISVAILLSVTVTEAKEKSKTSAQFSAKGKKVTVFTTAKDTSERLASMSAGEFKPKEQPVETETVVFVDPNSTFQTILGFGGALTDASAETFAKLPKDAQAEFMQAYFSPEKGIGYTLARTSIHSCDFSSASYTYIQDGDADLKTFSVEHDKAYRIPFIKDAITAAGGKLTLYASPWSPPAFMKDNNDLLHGGKLKKEYYPAWANYFAKFIKAYKAEGIPIWGVSIQNEPMARQKWESCVFTDDEERDFLKGHLGPTLRKAGLGDKKIIGWDHNRDLLYQRASSLLRDPDAAKYLWGIGFHWYETWTGGQMMHDNVARVHEAFPNTNLLFTEGTEEKFDPKRLTDWALGEKYGSSIIRDINAGAVGFTDWNVLLDENGGPNHVGNFCFAPVHADTKTGKLTYTNSYYYIGHFSKFVKPGAKRVSSSASRSRLLTTAFKNPDGSIAVVVMSSEKEKTDYSLWINGQAVALTAPARSISTIFIAP
jgi:glucosylceramidase